jgi:hypothetical protein
VGGLAFVAVVSAQDEEPIRLLDGFGLSPSRNLFTLGLSSTHSQVICFSASGWAYVPIIASIVVGIDALCLVRQVAAAEPAKLQITMTVAYKVSLVLVR